MKYKLLLLLVLVVLGVGCRETNTDDNGKKVDAYGTTVLTINRCQYIVYRGDRCAAMVHAANCSNYQHIEIKRDHNGDYTPTITPTSH